MKVLVLGALLICSTVLRAQIEVDDSNYTVEALVKDVLINSNCAETSNYTSSTGTSENINGIGYFNANGTDFPFTEGIILSTGRARDARGPNIDIGDSGSQNWPGDNDLRVATGTGILFNATYIEFDFVPLTNSISFNFLFASEEYQEHYQCIYSDAFAFILTDSEGISTNLAIIPNTALPVRATTIRPGVPGECGARNVNFFDKINGPDAAISFHGQTKRLKAEATVNPGEVYSIKLVISDNQDSKVDSAVFLEAGSFSLDYDLGQNRTVANGNPACIGETISLDAAVDGVQDYRWFKNGVEVTQWAGNSQANLTEEGEYRVDLVFSPTCIATGRLAVEYVVPPKIPVAPVSLVACDVDGDGMEIFDFTANGKLILGEQNPEIYGVTYYKTNEDAQLFTNAIENTDTYETNSPETIFARISSGNSCYEIASFELRIQNLDFRSSLEEEYVLCLDASGKPLEPLPVLHTGLSSEEYTFKWYTETISSENVIPIAEGASYTANSTGIYHIVLRNLEYGCEFSISTKVVVSQQPSVFEVVTVSNLFTNNNSIEIIAEGNSTYLHSVDDGPFIAGYRFENLKAGEHIALVTDAYGCSVLSKEFLVVDFPRFFSPNGDGVNDVWNIVGFPEIEKAEISIFDKYGILQYRFNDGSGWDGTVNRIKAPSSDYWFSISYVQDDRVKEFKSHFTLKR